MSRKLKKRLYRIITGIVLLGVSVAVTTLVDGIHYILKLMMFMVPYLVSGYDVVWGAFKNIIKGQVFDENFLMSIATIGAFFVGDYPEAVAVMLFYQVGELFQSYAVNRSRRSISELMDIRPDVAFVKRDNEVTEVDPSEVLLGETIVVKPGEKIPLDGEVVLGETTLDTRALTGESIPREATASDKVISGCVNLTGVIEVKVEKEFQDSTVSKILELVENAGNRKAQVENFITRFARYYTPLVVIFAALLAVLPPLFGFGSFRECIYRALSFLVISCPCALVISVPLSFFGGIGGAGRAGILVKGSNYLEALADAKIVVMDKTGTLTKGNFVVTDIVVMQDKTYTENELLILAGKVEYYSNHPISCSLMEALKEKTDFDVESTKGVTDVRELAGFGMEASVDGKKVYVGNAKLMEQNAIDYLKVNVAGTVIHVAMEKEYLGYILVRDEIKPDAKEAIKSLKASGINKVIMLTGDRKEIASSVADELSLDEYYSDLLPIDKVNKVEALLKDNKGKDKLIFVGDGINDAPVLARADIGIAMGGLGADAAIEAADVVIMTDEPSKISQVMRIAWKTLSIVKQNIFFALFVKGIVLILAALGYASMWAAVFADVGVAVIAILNAMRAMRY